MATYVIGDIQGCLDPLKQLLEVIAFDPAQDYLWFAGDLVNRGPESLETLRFIKQLGSNATVVLGNHDFHCLMVGYGIIESSEGDTLGSILEADDRLELLDWLRHQTLVYYDQKKNACLVHAGVIPIWDCEKLLSLASEVEAALQSDDYLSFLKNLYGDTPDRWDDDLVGFDRLRNIVNSCTRLRFCTEEGVLDLAIKAGVEQQPEGFKPWFQHPRKMSNINIFFGHWAALEGRTDYPTGKVYAMDTGCVWGAALTALRLEDMHYFSVQCSAYRDVDN